MRLKLPSDLERFNFEVNKLQSYEGIIELKKIRKPRTINQNSFLHVLITLFGIELGYTIEESKTILKRKCEFMRYEKNGEVFLKRTRDFDTKELSDFITWIRNYAGMHGIYLPSSDEYLRNWAEIEKQIEQHKTYL